MLFYSKGSISRDAKAPLGRAKAKVHWTLWHPSRSLVIKKDIRLDILFLLPRSAMHFSNPCCFTARVRFLGTLKRPSVVPKPRSTGPWFWHPARALVKKSCHTNLINQCDSPNFNYKLLYILLILFNETLH